MEEVQRKEQHHCHVLQFEDSYEPPDTCEDGDATPELVKVAYDFVENRLTGIEKVVANALLAFGNKPNYQELAKTTGKEESNLNTVASKVRKKLREHLEQYELDRNCPKGTV